MAGEEKRCMPQTFSPAKKVKLAGINNCKKLNMNRLLQHIRVRPSIRRYFFVAPANISLTEQSFVLHCEQFVDDYGVAVKKFRDFGRSGYFNLYVNGVMQGSSFFQVNSQKLMLAPTGQTIQQGTPIIIESIGFYLVKKI